MSTCLKCGIGSKDIPLGGLCPGRGGGAHEWQTPPPPKGEIEIALERQADYRQSSLPAPEPTVAPHDPVSHPAHYTSHPSGIECIQITEHFNFNRGNAIKYIWRAGEKDNEVEDLKKAAWYLEREIARVEFAKELAEELRLKEQEKSE